MKSFVISTIKKINDLIVNEESTYINTAYIDNLEHDFYEGEEMGLSPYIQKYGCTGRYILFYAYLTPKLVEKVKESFEGVNINPYHIKAG